APPPEEPVTSPKAATAEPAPAKPAPVEPAPVKKVEVKPAPEPAPIASAAPPPAPAAAAPAAPAPTAPVPAAVAGPGAFLVQIGSFHSKDEAMATWQKLKGKNNDVLSSYSPDIAEADLGAKGVYQRLRFGPFQTRDDAARVCDQLKARKQDCLIAKR